jgi:hypothetical protein
MKDAKDLVLVTPLLLNLVLTTAESLRLPVYYDQQTFLPADPLEDNRANPKIPITVSLTPKSFKFHHLRIRQIGNYCVPLFY